MTERPDTTAIRAVADDGGGFNYRQTIRVLCDALDVARAERARLRTAHRLACEDVARNANRAEASEARIAAALNIEPVMGKNLTPRDEFAWGYNTALGDFHRALTGDTP